jgi:hypothetical protein
MQVSLIPNFLRIILGYTKVTVLHYAISFHINSRCFKKRIFALHFIYVKLPEGSLEIFNHTCN